MGYNTIHESVVTDILDSIKDGVKWVDGKLKPKSPKIRTAGSLARATSGLTLTFPVICTDTLDIETATMISKAIERKNISLLQMAFAAYNITNATDAVSHLAKFHTNMDFDKITVDKFVDIMETIDESAPVTTYPSEINLINEDCKRNCNFVMEDSLNTHSLLEFSQVNRYGHDMIIQEALNRPQIFDYGTGKLRDVDDDELSDDMAYTLDKNGNYDSVATKKAQAQNYYNSVQDDIRNKNAADNLNLNKDKLELDKDKFEYSKKDADRKYAFDRRKAISKASDDKRQYLSSQLLASDVKKANEMQPSLMIVNFYVNDSDRDLNIAQQIVAGVKSKLYPVASSDIINKVITKVVDADTMLKLVKVSTREISFVKDFLLGLDDAKLDALSKSRKGSGSAMFNALERRAIKGKIRKTLKLDNCAKAISTLVISVEEAEELKKYNNIDVMNPRIIAKFMEKMNLLYFVVVDTTSESINIFTDGDSDYEAYSFSALERESGDGAYKKVVKLMTSITN